MFLYFLFAIFSTYVNAPACFALAPRDETANPESCDSSLKRTLFGIVWSCVSTTILCAWTAVHPNVPPRSNWQALRNRLRLMFWMIVVPELVLAWAVRQLFAARVIRDTYNNSLPGMPKWKKWTLVEGHLLEMGGFTLVDPRLKERDPKDKIGQVLTYDLFHQLVIRRHAFEFPEMTAADIQDRSKGDALFKVIAILQTTWFMIQFVARSQQQLAITELEVVTLALASLNVVTFAIWWYKPLCVQEPVRIYWEVQIPNPADGAEDPNILSSRDIIRKGWRDVKFSASAIVHFFLNPCKSRPFVALAVLFAGIPFAVAYVITFPFLVLFPLGISLLLKIVKTEPVTLDHTQNRGLLAARIITFLHNFRYSLSSAVARFVGTRLNKIFSDSYVGPLTFLGNFFFSWYILLPLLFTLLLLFVIFLLPFLSLLFLIAFIFASIFGIVTTSTIRPGASHVPSFYAPVTQSDRWSRMVVFAFFGVIFGGIHVIGWTFDYPTDTERTLWGATSLSIAVIPIIVAAIDYLLATRLRDHDINSCKRFERIALLILDLIMTILLFIYVPARLSLIAQALVLLRKQPPNAFVAVDWTKYIPHLFS